MKTLVDFISESLASDNIKELFKEIDKKLKDQEWDEVAPLIESIFKNKWGKPIKLDDKFRDKIDTGAQHLLLGYNIKSKAWIIVRYNRRAHGLRGAIYNGDHPVVIGNGPVYWSNIPRLIEDDKLKLRFGEAYSNDTRVVVNAFDMLDYDFDK